MGLELLANLAGPGKSLHYDDCLKGLVGMANHCYQHTEDSIHLIPHPYLHIAINFFNRFPKNVEPISKNMAGVVMDFKDDYVKAIEGHHQSATFSTLKTYIDREEAVWVSEIESHIAAARREVLNVHPYIKPKQLRNKILEYIDSGLFVPKISMAIIFAIAQSLRIRMTEHEHIFKRYELPRTFPFSVAFYQWICHRVVVGNIDLQNNKSQQTRWNWRWDYEVSFLMNDHLLNDRIVLFVTADKDMIKMMHNYGYGERVMDLNGYLKFLNS